jgi:hypothetical protein
VENFDQVFIACHSDQALGLLSDPSPEERQILGAIRYQANEALLHTDTALMPRRRLAWAAWNYHLGAVEFERAAVTYNMNILQSLGGPAQFLLTLNRSGAMLLQAITIRDQFYDQARRSVDFIKRFIFPGSFIPSVQTLVNSVARATDFKLSHLEDFGPHYALTLKAWRERFLARRAEVRALGYPERFVRMWEFYLCYCEGGFEERQLGVVQMLLTRPRSRRAAIATVHAPTSRP